MGLAALHFLAEIIEDVTGGLGALCVEEAAARTTHVSRHTEDTGREKSLLAYSIAPVEWLCADGAAGGR